eukprot:scaffold699_cov231-Pinguiococcus_pyrenoidosus.AAC.7
MQLACLAFCLSTSTTASRASARRWTTASYTRRRISVSSKAAIVNCRLSSFSSIVRRYAVQGGKVVLLVIGLVFGFEQVFVSQEGANLLPALSLQGLDIQACRTGRRHGLPIPNDDFAVGHRRDVARVVRILRTKAHEQHAHLGLTSEARQKQGRPVEVRMALVHDGRVAQQGGRDGLEVPLLAGVPDV